MATPPPSHPPVVVFHLGPTLGVAYIGIVLSAMLYSLTCVQTFLYFQSYSSKDNRLIKTIVLFMLVIDSVHQAFLIHAGYYYLIAKYAQPAALQAGVWSLISAVFFNGISGFIVESFFIWRLYRLSGGNKWLCGFLSILAVSHIGTNFAWPIQALKNPQFSNLQALGGTAESGFAISVVTDWIIAISLVYYLWRSRTHFKRTDTMINRLIAYTVSTGGLTSITTLVNLIAYAAWPNDFYYTFFNFMITPLYSNSLLVTLNTRDHVRDASLGQTTSAGVQSIPFSSIWRTRRTGTANNHSTDDVGPAVVKIDMETLRVTQTRTQDADSYTGDRDTTGSRATKPEGLLNETKV